MSKVNNKTTGIEQITVAVDRVCLDDERINVLPEQLIMQREIYNEKADLKQTYVIRFPPILIPVTSQPANSTVTGTVTLGELVSAEAIATAAAAGAYAMRVNVKSHMAIISNLNNEMSGSYDMTLVGSNLVNNASYYKLENVHSKIVAEQSGSGDIYTTANMPINQSLGTVVYNVVYDFNQMRAIASNVLATATLDISIIAEVIFSYAGNPVPGQSTSNNGSASNKKVATPRKFF